MKNKTFIGHIAALFTIIIWGTTFISTKVLLEVFTPIEILFIRFIIGYIALWCVCPHSLSLTHKKQEWFFAGAGLCGITLYFLFENIALTYTSASNVGVITSVAPFFTVIFTCLFLHEERPNFHFFIGFIIAMLGISIIIFGNQSSIKINPLGDLLSILSAVIFAAYSTITKKIFSFGYPTIQTTRRIFFYGLIFMLPVLFFMGFHVDFKELLMVKSLLNLLFLGLGASAVCFVTWNFAVKTLGSVKTSVYIYIIPIITAITSSLILHEKITSMIALGIVLTLVGLFLSEYKKSKKNAC